MLTGLIGLGLLRRAAGGSSEITVPDDELFGARASMEPVGVSLVFRTSRDGRLHMVERDSFASARREELTVEATFDGEVLELAVVAHEALRMGRARIELRHAFASDERVLLNGYQSWTDTQERSPWARMRGLEGVPAAVRGRNALDALGDYGFVEYSARRGVQHGFTYATFRRGAGMVLVGSLDERGGFTLIRTDAAAGRVTLETECPQRELAPGERVVLGRYVIARGDEKACYDRFFALANVACRPVRPLVGYSSWYRRYGAIDEAGLLADLDGAANSVLASDAASGPARCATRLFQIDDGYCKVGDWLSPDAAKFPRGLAPLAEAVRAKGFLPGLWVAPFVCERDSRLFAERGEWLLRDESGEPVRTGGHWSGGYALDTRNVEVRSYVLDVLQTMTRDWGFGLLKVDFLYAACLAPHDGMNRGELMADAMGLVRKGAGEALVDACGVPLASAFGVADFCRIGCDVGLDWDDVPHMRLLHRERVSTKRSLANAYGRAPLDRRAFGNDPDVFFLRNDVRLSQAQRDELLFADADLGSVLLTSDDMGAWDELARRRYEAALRVFCDRAKGAEVIGEGAGHQGGPAICEQAGDAR